MQTTCKPFLKWIGGKGHLLPLLKTYWPHRHRTIIEPFFGGGAVFFGTECDHAILSDINEELMTTYMAIKHYPREVMRALDLMAREYSQDFYEMVKSSDHRGSIEVTAARFIFINRCGFNGLWRVNSKGECNVPFGHKQTCPRLYSPEVILAASAKLQSAHVTLRTWDFENTIRLAQRGDLVYCDPPYVPMSKTASFVGYSSKGFSNDDFQRLVKCCREARARGASVWMSNSIAAQKLVDEMSGIPVHEIENKRSCSAKVEGRGIVRELLMEFV